jgi:hypothetical protein
MKTYQAWTKSKKGGQEVITECKAKSMQDFKKRISENGAKVIGRVRVKK